MVSQTLITLLLATTGPQSGTFGVEQGRPATHISAAPAKFVPQPNVQDDFIWRLRSPRVAQVSPPQQPDIEQDVVFFAADSVEFQLPFGWSVQETPWRRDIFLQLNPNGQFSPNPRELVGGVWLRYRPTRFAPADRDITTELSLRMRAALDSMPRIGEPRSLEIGGYAALLQECLSPSPSGEMLPAAHLIVITPWGTFEMRATESGTQTQFISAATGQLLQSIRFHSPAPGIGAGKPAEQRAVAASSIFGTWKAINGRLQILHDGRVAMEFDRKQVIRFDESGSPKFRQPNVVLIGKYNAAGDVINVTWEDGSQTNYRWNLQGENLLLTDHEGRVSQLAPVFE